MKLGQLLMYVGYDTTVVLVQHGTEEQICIFTESEELEYTKEHEKVRQKYIDKDVELQIVDRIVLQYEQRINELEEQLNELHRKRH